MVFGDSYEVIRTHLQVEAAKVRNYKANWALFLRARLISQQDYDFIVTYEAAEDKNERNVVLNAYKEKTLYSFIHLITQISRDDYIRYILTIIDDLIGEDFERIALFEETADLLKRTVYSFFTALLHRQDPYAFHITSSILTKIATHARKAMAGDDLDYFMEFLRLQMNRGTANDYIATTARCMQTLFRHDSYRVAFANHKGFESLIHALYATRKCGFQIQYQIVFCMWLLTFNQHAAELTLHCNVIQTIVNYLGSCQKEKVIRIVLATLRNILFNMEGKVLKKQASLQMIQCKLLKKLEHTATRKFDDIDVKEDIEYLKTELEKVVQVLTSFDEYENEIRVGALHWSPAHKSDKFWTENVQKFNNNKFEILKMLISFLENSTDPLVLCVAAHDVGEYARYNPKGKPIIEQLGGKEAMMRLLCAKDPNVRYHALLAAQKLMVQNWKYLGLEDQN